MKKEITLNFLKPKLKDYFQVIPMEKNQCQLRAEGRRMVMLRGESVYSFIPFLLDSLDGKKTVNEIIESLKKIARKDVVTEALGMLNDAGVLEDGEVKNNLSKEELKLYDNQLRFFSHFGAKHDLQEKLKKATIAILGLGNIGSHILKTLALSGIGKIIGIDEEEKINTINFFFDKNDMNRPIHEVINEKVKNINPSVEYEGVRTQIKSPSDIIEILKKTDALVACRDNISYSLYEIVNDACLETKTPWILCGSMDQIEIEIGPFIIPYETSCYKCYELRKKSNLYFYNEFITFEKYLKKKPNIRPNSGSLLPFASLMSDFVVIEIIKHITGFEAPETYGRQLIIDLIKFEMEFHEIFKIPRCPSCSNVEKSPAKAFWTKSYEV